MGEALPEGNHREVVGLVSRLQRGGDENAMIGQLGEQALEQPLAIVGAQHVLDGLRALGGSGVCIRRARVEYDDRAGEGPQQTVEPAACGSKLGARQPEPEVLAVGQRRLAVPMTGGVEQIWGRRLQLELGMTVTHNREPFVPCIDRTRETTCVCAWRVRRGEDDEVEGREQSIIEALGRIELDAPRDVLEQLEIRRVRTHRARDACLA